MYQLDLSGHLDPVFCQFFVSKPNMEKRHLASMLEIRKILLVSLLKTHMFSAIFD